MAKVFTHIAMTRRLEHRKTHLKYLLSRLGWLHRLPKTAQAAWSQGVIGLLGLSFKQKKYNINTNTVSLISS